MSNFNLFQQNYRCAISLIFITIISVCPLILSGRENLPEFIWNIVMNDLSLTYFVIHRYQIFLHFPHRLAEFPWLSNFQSPPPPVSHAYGYNIGRTLILTSCPRCPKFSWCCTLKYIFILQCHWPRPGDLGHTIALELHAWLVLGWPIVLPIKYTHAFKNY